MGVETENYEIAAKGFENTRSWFPFLVIQISREILPVGYLKGLYKSESSLMTCAAELHGSVIRMPSSILSHISSAEKTSTRLSVLNLNKGFGRCYLFLVILAGTLQQRKVFAGVERSATSTT